MRQGQLAPLQPFLQFGFGVFGSRLHLRLDLDILEQTLDQALRGAVATVQIDRTDHGLDRIGQDGRALAATRLELALTQPKHFRQLHLQGQVGQRVLLDQIGTHPRKVSLGQLAQLRIQQMRHRQIEHRVTQKLQPLIVVGAETSVRDRLL